MCGIVGCLHPGEGADALTAQVARMADTLVHRGPDGGDVWANETEGIALGFRRLAVVDLSPTGMQPMASHSGRYTVVFNGEIYNHGELREQLSGVAWRGSSDTETLLATFDRWGVVGALPRLVGMFAIAVWDHQQRTLTLARDRIGEKPMFYGVHRGVLLFGSELKALRAHPAFDGEVDGAALAAYLYASFVPAPQSIWRHTHKLPPGHHLTVGPGHLVGGTLPTPQAYWSLHEHARRPSANPMGDAEIIDRVDAVLRQAVSGQMVADVPLGAFLSGGIDSSLIVALMQALSSTPVSTFTIGIPGDAGLDESAYAARVAAHLGTRHHALQVTPSAAQAVIPMLGTMYDEPFADASQIPTHLVAALARQHVTVGLSGDGGDEVFGGYRRYLLAPTVARRTRHVPQLAARAGRASITGVPVRLWDRARPGLGARAHRLAGLVPNRGVEDVYRRVFGTTTGLGLVPGHRMDPASVFHALPDGPGDAVDRMMYRDSLTYLPDDICAKVDRAAMAVSLETRMPYVDHRVVELAWSLPQRALLRDGTTKWALRQVLARYVPPGLTERPKAGFGLPLAAWLREPLREWADDTLALGTVRAQGYLDAAAVQRLWAAHRSGRRDHTNVLWNVLMFQSWLQANEPPPTAR